MLRGILNCQLETFVWFLNVGMLTSHNSFTGNEHCCYSWAFAMWYMYISCYLGRYVLERLYNWSASFSHTYTKKKMGKLISRGRKECPRNTIAWKKFWFELLYFVFQISFFDHSDRFWSWGVIWHRYIDLLFLWQETKF